MNQTAERPGWKDMPIGGKIVRGATATEFRTGDWRTLIPVWYPERCIHCLRCWIACPDMAVIAEDGKMVGFDYEHCKGCGLCAKECPSKVHAIDMIPEERLTKEDELIKQSDARTRRG